MWKSHSTPVAMESPQVWQLEVMREYPEKILARRMCLGNWPRLFYQPIYCFQSNCNVYFCWKKLHNATHSKPCDFQTSCLFSYLSSIFYFPSVLSYLYSQMLSTFQVTCCRHLWLYLILIYIIASYHPLPQCPVYKKGLMNVFELIVWMHTNLWTFHCSKRKHREILNM